MSNAQIAIFAGGCFWCTEPVFSQLKGVHSVVSGYIGGHTQNPSYKDICNGDTGHAEGIRITFDADVVSYEVLLEIFLVSARSNHAQIVKATTLVRSIALPYFAKMMRNMRLRQKP